VFLGGGAVSYGRGNPVGLSGKERERGGIGGGGGGQEEARYRKGGERASQMLLPGRERERARESGFDTASVEFRLASSV